MKKLVRRLTGAKITMVSNYELVPLCHFAKNKA